jgi:membrane-bound lytic murein transglycosylase D
MKTSPTFILNIAIGCLIGFLIAGSFAFVNNNKEVISNRKSNPGRETIRPPQLPESMTFAGEKVPLEKTDIKEKFDRELMINYYNSGNILFLLKSANKYFPVISARLKANGVPDDFKYLCIAESNLVPTALSGAGAVSFWQFMNGTAPGFGLELNKEVDQRYDIEKATDAACAYLKNAYNQFGSWTAAAASYNCGQGGYNSQATFQGTKNYYDLLLPEETNRYIFRILAFKHLLENANELGFSVDENEKYQPVQYREVAVTSSISNLAAFARSQGTNYKTLRQLNPWLRGRSLTIKNGKRYIIRFPVAKSF